MQRSSSSPAIVATARDLRKFSVDRRRLSPQPVEAKPPEANMVQLLVDLKGSNGRWKQDRAKEKYAEELKVRAENDRKERLREARKCHAAAIEAARQKKLQEAERRRLEEIAERERRQREEELALLRAKQAQEEHNEACREQLRVLKHPRPCHVCKGLGKCTTCGGKAYFEATYLAHTTATGRKHDLFHGRTRRGCAECGGYKKDEDEGNVVVPQAMSSAVMAIAGSGLCSACDGTGKTRLCHANIVGAERSWLGDIQALLRQMIPAELALLLSDKIWVLQLVAAEVLLEKDKSRAYPHQISPLLTHKHWRVRQAAAASLGGAGPSAAPYVTNLRELIKDPVQDVRKVAVQSVGNVCCSVGKVVNQQGMLSTVKGELNQLQYDKDEDISAIAREALKKIKESMEDN